MARTPLPRHRLASAVTVALAVTVGTLAASPALAGTPSATTISTLTTAEDVLPLPADAVLYGAGPTGFLSAQISGTSATFRWTRYADGGTTILPKGSYTTSPGTDIVTKLANPLYTLYDMGTGAEPVTFDLSPLGEGYGGARSVGGSLVTTRTNAEGGRDVHIVGMRQGALADETVTGLPADAAITHIDIESPTEFVVLYTTTVDGTPTSRAAVVDVASHAVVEQYETQRTSSAWPEIALSATHITWIERPTDSLVTLATARRGTAEVQRVPLGKAYSRMEIGLVGNWVTYGQTGGYEATMRNSLYALTARSLTTGESVTLLDDLSMTRPGPDGTRVVRGGRLADGEGLYRVAVGENGVPVARLLASTGRPTTLETLGRNVPESIDLDRDPMPVHFDWTLSRTAAFVQLELTHRLTGKRVKLFARRVDGVYRAAWDGNLVSYDNTTPAEHTIPAYNGDYTWRITAPPANGIGPALEQTGTFTVTRKNAPHDFNDNGSPDLLVRDYEGDVSVYNPSSPLGAESPSIEFHSRGWNVYDQLVAPGDIAGSAYGDIVSRDKTGVLWLHQGAGRALAPRVKVSGGWQIYNRITGGSDLTGDGRSDLLATDKAGDLWLHKSTGAAASPFAPRKKVGYGWGIYNRITATGDIGGGPAGDLVARDTAGVLWLYLGKGDGTFAPRTRISGGWGPYGDLVGVGDIDGDGRPDLVANDAYDGTPYYYRGTGDWRAPLQGRQKVYSSYWDGPVTMF
ncbi:FG-GAP repeat domain-containing protein [Streptomyces sp. NPDC006477]|uniref:FG-GAP repeat domain-containing protein n=1 Tax=Streptomyces sp. NPDC006477 TaxID=3364747 RepID=UPI0036A8DA8C